MMFGLVKNSRRVVQSGRQVAASFTSGAQRRLFSAQEPTAEEIKQNKEEWGEKYHDEIFKFEKEWQMISQKISAESKVYLEKELSEIQKKKVEMLADKLLDMNVFEI